MTAQVYIFGPSFSNFVRSVMLCCEEKGISYQVGTQPGGLSKEQLQSLHPFGRIPALIHDGKTLFETAPICRYLDTVFDGPTLQPTNAYERAVVDQWTQALTCYVDELIVRKYLLEFAFPKGEGGSVRMDVVKENTPGVMEMLAIVEKQLGSQEFFCSESFSIADALLGPMLDYLVRLPYADQLFKDFSASSAYITRIQQRASGQVVLKAFGS